MPLQLLGSNAENGEMVASTGAPHSSHSHHPPAGPAGRREVECFDCHAINRASLQATSTACSNCGTYIDLRNFDIRERTTQKIRTRGDVTVHKKGALLGTAIHCGSLIVEGTVGGSIYAQETVQFRVSTKVLGELRCRRLIVERKCLVHCLQPVHVREVDIEGGLTARIFSGGPVRLHRHARLEGSVNAPVFIMEPGAELEASMHIFGRNSGAGDEFN
ncbi:MAG: polymer-forming cytoskeletal protein [Verrucomicrobiota bacterium]